QPRRQSLDGERMWRGNLRVPHEPLGCDDRENYYLQAARVSMGTAQGGDRVIVPQVTRAHIRDPMPDKPLHIGIVACSAEGAALCYRTICIEGGRLLGSHAHPEVSMHTLSLGAYEACLAAGDLEGVGALMLSSAGKLATIGADFLICP